MGDATNGGSTKRARRGSNRRRLSLAKLTVIVAAEAGRLALAPIVRGAIATVGLSLVVAAACASPPLLAPPPPRRPVVTEVPPPPMPAWTYWEGIDVPAVQGVEAVELPVDVAKLGRTPGADVRWAAAPRALREAVAERGFAVIRAAHPGARLGDFYAGLRDDRVAWVVTLDALFFLTHVALDRAFADVDASYVAPAIGTVLRRLETRLDAESRRADADMEPSYHVARGVVAVALALLQQDYKPPPELVPLVEGEMARVVAHTGVGVSPWLGSPIDYSAMTPHGAADRDERHSGWYRAVAWLEGAALALEGAGEGPVRAQVDVATARVHARAAMLLARLLEYDVDAEAAIAWDRVDRAGTLLVGDADDPTPRDMSAAAAAQKLDLRSADWLPNVAPMDRVRHAAARIRLARTNDGALDPTAPTGGLDPLQPIGRTAPAFRLLGPRATPDGELLQALVFPLVGGLSAREPPPTARAGVRAMPTGLDVVSWLGSAEARDALHASGDDAYGQYPETIERFVRARPPEGSIERHRTPYVSMLDAMETWLHPSAGDRVQPGGSTSEWRARKASVALGAWTELRHDATAMSRLRITDVTRPPQAKVEPAVPVFVEPHPEAIAKLLALVRQTQRVLYAEGAIAEESPGYVVLDEVDDLLWQALGVAVHETADQEIPPGLASNVAAFPARLRALEASLADSGAADVPIVADVHTDRASGQVLEESLGPIEELWTVAREPGTHRLWLVVGASIPQHELVRPMSARWSDAGWRAHLASDGEPAPAPIERGYFIATP
jgi:hypothetical protein